VPAGAAGIGGGRAHAAAPGVGAGAPRPATTPAPPRRIFGQSWVSTAVTPWPHCGGMTHTGKDPHRAGLHGGDAVAPLRLDVRVAVGIGGRYPRLHGGDAVAPLRRALTRFRGSREVPSPRR